jgi:hypothetical protein
LLDVIIQNKSYENFEEYNRESMQSSYQIFLKQNPTTSFFELTIVGVTTTIVTSFIIHPHSHQIISLQPYI